MNFDPEFLIAYNSIIKYKVHEKDIEKIFIFFKYNFIQNNWKLIYSSRGSYYLSDKKHTFVQYLGIIMEKRDLKKIAQIGIIKKSDYIEVIIYIINNIYE